MCECEREREQQIDKERKNEEREREKAEENNKSIPNYVKKAIEKRERRETQKVII